MSEVFIYLWTVYMSFPVNHIFMPFAQFSMSVPFLCCKSSLLHQRASSLTWIDNIVPPFGHLSFVLTKNVALAQGKEFSFQRLCKRLCTQKKPTETEDSYLESWKSVSFVGTARPVGDARETPDEARGPEWLCAVRAASSRDGWRTLADVAPLGTFFLLGMDLGARST